MAKIFISYSLKDRELVMQYVDILAKYGHTILMDDTVLKGGQKMQQALMNAMQNADGTVAFITESATKNVNSEIGAARIYMEKEGKFLIPLVKGGVEVPYTIEDLTYLQIEGRRVEDIVKEIDALIKADDRPSPNKKPDVSNAQRSEQPPASPNAPVNKDTKYWLLKIYGDHWELKDINEGVECYFHSLGERSDYKHFNAVNTGDKGLAYDYSTQKAIVFTFEVDQPLHLNDYREKIFTFKVTSKLERGLPITSFGEFIGFADQLDESSPNKLFELSEANFKLLSQLIGGEQVGPVNKPANRSAFSAIFSDSAAKNIQDQLGLEADINALASVIVYKEVKPPLAIGLFGNWGSGKSFFMNKLQERITDLSKSKEAIICKHVLQINFNSWHYSDSNLWASLITKIFEELEKYGEKEGDKVTALFKNLHSTKELLLETTSRKTAVENEIEKLRNEQKIFEKEIKTSTEKLKPLSYTEIVKEVLAGEAVQEDIEKLNQLYAFLDVKEYGDISSNLQKIEDTSGKLIQSLKIIYSFRKGKGWIALLAAILVAAGVYLLIQYSGNLKAYVGDYKVLIGIISTLLTQLVFFLKPAMAVVNSAYKRLKSLNDTVNRLKEKAKSRYSAQEEQLKQKLEQAQSSFNEIQKNIELLSVQQQQLQIEINDIGSGKKIVRFIESRVTDVKYVNSLGIISWVRKDFEELDFLLKQQYDVRKLEESGREKVENIFELERIILYIDDLDRCHESIVVKVLEAIHLLLAFPLFVVVVGVDPRWVHNAITKQYANLVSVNNGVQPEGIPRDQVLDDEPATSYDYLEKIFQIPFTLKPMTKDGRNNLVRAQLEPQQVEAVTAKKEGTVPGGQAGAGNGPAAGTEGKKKEGPTPQSPNTPGKEALVDDEEKVKGDPGGEKPAATVNTQTLQVSEEEIVFLQQVSFLIGDSPRTIKRYINVYRIIRTHNTFDFTDGNEQEHYYAAMVILAVVTSMPDHSKSFIDTLDTALDTQPFHVFLKSYLEQEGPCAPLARLAYIMTENIIVRALANIRMEKFKKNSTLIRRFSFRNHV